MRAFFPILLLLASAATAPPAHIEWQPQTSGVTARLRGISAVSERVGWASGASGTILRTTDGGTTWQTRSIPDTAALDFRDIDAIDDAAAYVMSIGPGESSRIYKTIDGGEHWGLQFSNTDPKVFLDAMAFWDRDRGVAFSDSVDGRFVILTTATGGRVWSRVPADRLPAALPGEGAFAASGTNVAVNGRSLVWIATTAGRVLRSADAGKTWNISATRVRTATSAGIFSVAFRSASHGIVVGGDFNKLDDAVQNAATTSDGGVTWTLVETSGLRGYRSVAAWAGARRTAAIALGPSGGDVSLDDGRTWMAIDGPGYDTASFAPGTRTGWAAGENGRIAKLTFHE